MNALYYKRLKLERRAQISAPKNEKVLVVSDGHRPQGGPATPGRRGCCTIGALRWPAVCAAAIVILFGSARELPASAELSEHDHSRQVERSASADFSRSERRFAAPKWQHVLRVVSLRDYNTRVVLLGTLLFGICAGVVGTFMLLRKRALVGDVVSHASLPGIGVAFLVMERIEAGSGKSLPGLLTGAFCAGLAGVLCTVGIRRYSRIKEDTALAIVLSVFFGLGIALFTVIQNIPSGNVAGLHSFIYGKTASMIRADVVMIGWAAFVVLLVCGLLLKEFSLLCFDEEFASVQGWPVVCLDLLLMGLVVAVTVIGLQSVGLLLVVAMLIMPSAAARFWTDHLPLMTFVSALLGGLSAVLGVMTSALFPRLAAGAVIVLVGAMFFAFSLFFGARRGVVRRFLVHRGLKRKVGRHDLLRAFYESLESSMNAGGGFTPDDMTEPVVSYGRLLSMRSWPARRLSRLLAAAARQKLVRSEADGGYRLTKYGALEAQRVVRNHRLWEIYLITYADIAPSHVDREADQIEHVLEPELIEELDALSSERFPQMVVPPSPHEMEWTAGGERG